MKSFIFLTVLMVPFAMSQTKHPQYSRAEIQSQLFTVQRSAPLLEKSEEQSEVMGAPEKKSVTTAVLYSLLLPGMGEMYVGNYGMGKYFTIAEGVLWITLLGFDRYGTWLQDDARNFAAQHAQAKIDGKEDQFFIDLGNDNDVYAYNQRILQNRDEHKVYSEDPNSIFYWKWDSPTNREFYRDKRVSSNQMFNNTRFAAAAIGVNHLLSAINAARIAFAHNKNIDHADLINIQAKVIGGLAAPDGIVISFSKNF